MMNNCTLEIRSTVRDARNVRKYKNERETAASASKSAIIGMHIYHIIIIIAAEKNMNFSNNYFLEEPS